MYVFILPKQTVQLLVRIILPISNKLSYLNIVLKIMNKKTSVLLTATIVTILAGILATGYAQSVFAKLTIDNRGGPGGSGGTGGAGGTIDVTGTSSHVLRANGGDANGGRGGDAVVIFSDSCIRADC